MPQDTFQIALEHHRAGRLRQAEAGYRALLADDPAHPDAAHWLGVLLAQAGQFDAAEPLLERAAAARPGDAAFQHNLGHALTMLGRHGEAAAAYERAVAADPGRAESLVALARACLVRGAFGDADAAVDALRRARDAGDGSAELHHDLGVALLAAEQPDAAIAALRAATEKRPGYASALYHQALAHRAKGEPAEARRHLTRALDADAGHARAWHALAALDAEAGNLEVAAGLYRRAIRARADFAAAHAGLAAVLARLGRRTEAAAAGVAADRLEAARLAGRTPVAGAPPPVSVGELEDRITPTPEGARLHESVAVKLGLPPPPRVSALAVGELFDRYADRFDAHLRGTLEYRVPEQMAAAVAAAAGPGCPPMDVLDLGCGTGLCGPFFRPMARTLAGVDLSNKMLEKAAARGAYDRLEAGDLLAALGRAPAAYDLLIAADVLIYFGDLAPVFEAAAAALRPGGLFAYSVEAGDGDRFQLVQDTRRYTHAAAYLKRLAAMYGFGEASFASVTGRVQAHRPVPSYLVVLRAPG